MPLFRQFETFPELRLGFSEKRDGSMRVSREDVSATLNRERFFAKAEIDPKRVVSAGLVHGNRVACVGHRDAGTWVAETDGLVTRENDLYLTITASDCFPVYVFDPVTHSVGLAHVGWRGAVGGIAVNLVKEMQRLGAHAEDISVGIGPGIRVCHFQIREEQLPAFAAYPEAMSRRDGAVYIDLPSIIKCQLRKSGVVEVHIEDAELCTFDQADRYFSHRRDRVEPLQTMVAYIGLKA